MSEMNGKLVICDRCGATTFRRANGEGELDGGFTRWNKFEPIEEGWKYARELEKTLCPKCYAEYEALFVGFMPEDRNETCKD